MPSQSFRCPSCDASLTYDEDNPSTTVVCEYCNNTVIVPENLRRQQPTAVTIAPPRQGNSGCLVIGILLAVGLGVGALFFINFESVSAPAIESLPEVTQAVERTATPAYGGYLEQLLVIGGEEGSGPGFFKDSRWLGVDGDGRLYAADFDNKGRVQVFSADGAFINQWRIQDEGIIGDMGVARDGTVYILTPGKGIFIYDGQSGELTGELTGNIADKAFRFDAIAVNLAGAVLAVDREGMVWFNAAGEVTGNYPGIFDNIKDDSDTTVVIRDITLDSEDNLYVLTTFDSAIYKFNKEGVFVDRIGQEGEAPGDFTSPLALAVDGQGRIWVDDFSDFLIFDGNGRYLDTIPMDGSGFTLFFDTANNLYRMNRNDNRIEKYTLLN